MRKSRLTDEKMATISREADRTSAAEADNKIRLTAEGALSEERPAHEIGIKCASNAASIKALLSKCLAEIGSKV